MKIKMSNKLLELTCIHKKTKEQNICSLHKLKNDRYKLTIGYKSKIYNKSYMDLFLWLTNFYTIKECSLFVTDEAFKNDCEFIFNKVRVIYARVLLHKEGWLEALSLDEAKWYIIAKYDMILKAVIYNNNQELKELYSNARKNVPSSTVVQ